MTSKTFKPGRGYTKADWDDIDNPELTDEELAQARPFADVFPDLAESIRRSVGRPRSANARQPVTLRLTPETLARFERLGPDWRARMAEILERAEL